MEQEEAPPPPYSAVDPLIPPVNNSSTNTSQQTSVPLRENVTESSGASSSRIAEPRPSRTPAIVPTHFTSAAAYFEERPPSVLDDNRSILHHHITIYPRSQAKDFPRRPRCWAARADEIPQEDWDTFLRYLFPPQLGLAAASQHLPRQLRAEIQRDRKDRPQESDDQRHARILAVVDEWNQCFFEPRALRIVFIYIGEPDAAPSSALCPRCYPAATKATQGNDTSVPTEQQPPWTPNTSSPVPPAPGQHAPSPTGWPFHPGPFGAPPGPTPYAAPYGIPPNHYQPLNLPPGGVPWQWNNWNYAPPQNQSPGTSKGGAFGWISNITAQAQKYGERFAEQAQHYGDQISAQAMQYGRQVEEQALAHGRWLEGQGRFNQKQNPYPPTSYPYQATWGPPPMSGSIYNTPPPPSQTSPNEPGSPSTNSNSAQTQAQAQAQAQTRPQAQAEAQVQRQNQNQGQDQSQKKDKDKEISSPERTRRVSISSTTSESSLSSFNSLSTTSDLDAADLKKVRTQLQDLNDCHYRTLYDAASDLRLQLDVLQASRREARASGRQGWRQGRINSHQDPDRRDRNDWGQWDSPEEQERQATERRAMKEELRATKKAFREVTRRARQEQHEAKRSRRNRRRQQRQKKSLDGSKPSPTILTGPMENLSVNQPLSTHPSRAQTDPLGQTLNTPFMKKPVRAETSSSISSANSIHTPTSSQASMNERPGELPDRKGKSGTQSRLRDKLKPLVGKKQQRSATEPTSKDENSKGDKSSKKGKD